MTHAPPIGARSAPRTLLALLSAFALALSLLPILPAAADATSEVVFFDFDDSTPAPSSVAAGFDVSDLTAASGAFSFFQGNPSSGSAASLTGWNNDDQFFEFTVSPPESGVELTGFSFDDRASGTGPDRWAVTIVDDLEGAVTETTVGESDGPDDTSTSFRSRFVDLSELDERTEPFAIRIRGFGASSPNGTYRVDNLSLTAVGEGGDDTDPDPQPGPACDVPSDELTLISEVQGPGSSSPLVGETVTVEALVTLDSAELNGVFIQEEQEDWVDEDTTSQGLFVFRGSSYAGADLEPGATVQVTGPVSEFFGLTQITSIDEVEVCEVEPVEIEPVELPLPSSPEDRERFESMLITADDLVVSGSFLAWQRQELITGYQGELPSATEIAAPGPEAETVATETKAREVILNDRFGNDFSRSIWDADPERRLGDRIPSVTGVLNFTFGNFKIEYTEFPEFELIGAPEVPELDEGNDIGAFNVLNYFNEFGDSSRLRGARNQAQFELQTAKIVETILELDASVLGLIELQNDYLDEFDDDPTTEPSVATLVDFLNDAAGEDRYDYVRMPQELLETEGLNDGGVGTDAIANGIIYQPERVTQVGEASTVNLDEGLFEVVESSDEPVPAAKSRWPFAASFDIDGRVVTVAVNHFKSKGSGCEDVFDGSDTPAFELGEDVTTDLTGSCDLTRQYAANALVDWIGTDPTGADTDEVLLVGDFNAYAQEAPIQIMKDAGYVNTVEELADGAFTYKFSGRVGTLDYIMASESAFANVDEAAVWQTNSRASYVDLYFIADDTTVASGNLPKGASDHDPLVVSLLTPEPPAPPSAPTDKDECKGGGWQDFTDPSFRNQGQCVSFVASGQLRGPASAGPPADRGPGGPPPHARNAR